MIMVYTQILAFLRKIRSVWSDIQEQIQALRLALPVQAIELQDLDDNRIEPALVRLDNEIPVIENSPNPGQALITAAGFFSGTVANDKDIFKGDWDTNLVSFLSPAERQLPGVVQVSTLISALEDRINLALDNIRNMESNDVGVAAANVSGAVRDAGNAIRDVTTYPLLTQEVAFTPSSIAPSGASGTASSGASIGMTVMRAINDVLGWKSKPGDPKAFLGALNASFTRTEVEGHVECKWTPRSYAVATDVGGGITGAQASLYTRAKEVIDLSLPLLDGIYTLDPTADKEDVDALKKVARDQMTELVSELGMMGGPRVSRVSQYFNLLLGTVFPMMPGTPVESDPNNIQGTLGTLREILGLNSATDDFVNSVDDEIDLTNFRILSDYITSLAQSWVNNLQFFMTPTPPGVQPFFGTQLVLLSRQLSVVGESVDEVRFAMDSVFIGPSERQTLPISVRVQNSPQPFIIYAEDLLSWVSTFALVEGPNLIQDGGKYAVGDAFAAQVRNLHQLVEAALRPQNRGDLPPAFFTGRVHTAWRELTTQLKALLNFARPISHNIETTVTRDVDQVLSALTQSNTFDDFKQSLQGVRAFGSLARATRRGNA
jgi:hypothetical protein